MEAFTVERSIWIAAPRTRVWRAITETEQLRKWWGHDYWEISAVEVGAVVKFGEEANPMEAKVAVVAPPYQFAIEWPPSAQYHAISMRTTYILLEENEGTRVIVQETGFEHLSDDIRPQRIEQTAKGYGTVLASLKTYIEQG